MFLNKINNKIICLGVFVIFLVLSLVFTKAPLDHLGSALPKGPDPLLVSWIWSWEMHQIPINPLAVFDTNIFAPFKNTLAFTEHMFGSLLLAWPLFLIFKNIILVFNIISLSSFAIGGLGMYLLAFYLTKNKAASFIAAFIYAFAPYKITHLEHINLSGMWLPYFFLYLHKIFKDFSWRHTLLLLFFTLMVFLNAMQYFLFLPVVIIFFILANIDFKSIKITKEFVLKLFIFCSIIIIVCLSVLWPYLQLKSQGFARSVDNIEGLSPDLYDYLVSPFFYKYFYPTYLSEWIVGPGVFVLLLLFFSIIVLHHSIQRDKTKAIYLLIGFVAVLFSLGYYIQFTRGEMGGLIGPWAFFYHFVPGFSGVRCVGRYSIFFLLSSAALISIGLRWLFVDYFKNKRKKILFVFFSIIILLFVEFSFVPPKEYVAVPPVPKIYNWIKNTSDINVYLELPLGVGYSENNLGGFYEYYSISHFKKMVNGYSGHSPRNYEGLIIQLCNFDIQKEDLSAIKNYGATHIIFHFDYYPPNFKSKIINRLSEEGLADLIYFVDNDYVYQLK
ncbi:YfhO family protein [Candidatus Kuenenbacteria bacterium]|nr:YfhO family protein [Candidatus Kuenenbacteria bacterium]